MSFDFDFIAAIAAFKPLSRLRVAFDGANVYIPKTPIITALRNKHDFARARFYVRTT